MTYARRRRSRIPVNRFLAGFPLIYRRRRV